MFVLTRSTISKMIVYRKGPGSSLNTEFSSLAQHLFVGATGQIF